MTAKNSRILARISFVLVLSAVGYLALWTLPAIALDVEIVTEAGDEGWELEHGACGSSPSTSGHAFVFGPAEPPAFAPEGRGSVSIQIGPNGDSFERFSQERFAGFNLLEITASDGRLRYWTNVQSAGTPTQQAPTPNKAPYMLLDIDRDNNGSHDDTLVYEPFRNGDLDIGQWQRWDAKAGRWWSTTDRDDGTGARPGSPQTLTQFRARFPNAELLAIRIGAGPISGLELDGCGEPNGWNGFSGSFDGVFAKIFTHEVMFDFEPEGTDREPSEGSPVPTPTRTTQNPTPSGSTTSPAPTGSQTSPGPDPTETQDPRCPAEPGQNVITGSGRGETIRGTNGDDVICSFGGNDVVAGRGGDDEIRLGAGNDEGLGASGWDDIFGARGRDLLKGGGGRDDLVGGPGRDRCVGGPGRDRFSSCERRVR